MLAAGYVADGFDNKKVVPFRPKSGLAYFASQ